MDYYKCISFKKINLDDYSVSAIRVQDIENIRLWRNRQVDVLRQKSKISRQEQEVYFNRNIWPSFMHDQPKQILFSFFYKEKLIGYGGLVHISWEDKRGELSYVVDDKRASQKNIYKQDFETFLNLMKYAAFEIIKFNRIFTETYSTRGFHISIIESLGFLFEGQLREHVIINNKKCHSLLHGMIHSDYQLDKTSNSSITIF